MYTGQTYQAVYQRHVDMLIKVPRQPILTPLNTSHIWLLKGNQSNKVSRSLEDLNPKEYITRQYSIWKIPTIIIRL